MGLDAGHVATYVFGDGRDNDYGRFVCTMFRYDCDGDSFFIPGAHAITTSLFGLKRHFGVSLACFAAL